MKAGHGRSHLWRYAARASAVSGVVLGTVTVVGNWTGFGWISGPAAIGALGALLLAFASAGWPAVTDGPQAVDASQASGDGTGSD